MPGRGRLCCGVYSCNNRGMHRLPKDEALRDQWISVARIDLQRKVPYRGLQFRKFTYICSKHFKPSDYIDIGRRTTRLKSTAVPSIFPWTPREKNVDDFTVTFDPSKVSRDYTRTEAVTFIAEIPNAMEVSEITEASNDPLTLYNAEVKKEDLSPIQLEEIKMVVTEDIGNHSTHSLHENVDNKAHTHHDNINSVVHTDNINMETHTSYGNMNNKAHTHDDNVVHTCGDNIKKEAHTQLDDMNNEVHTHDDNVVHTCGDNIKKEAHTQLDDMNNEVHIHDDNVVHTCGDNIKTEAHTQLDDMNNEVHTHDKYINNKVQTSHHNSVNNKAHPLHDDDMETLSKEVAVQTYVRLPPFSVHSYRYHKKAIEFFTGLESYEKLALVFQSLGKRVDNLKYIHGTPAKKLGMSPFEQFFMTLLVLRQNKSFIELSMMYLLPFKQVTNIFDSWIRFMSSQWRNLDLWVEKETKTAYFNMPVNCHNEYLRTRIVMCPTEGPDLPNAKTVKVLNSKNKDMGKVLIGVAHSGLITFVSASNGGSASKNKIIKASDILQRNDPDDDIKDNKRQDTCTSFSVKVDKGSVAKQTVQKKVISLLKKFKILSQLNGRNTFHSSDIVFICAMLVNFQSTHNYANAT